MTTVLFIVLGIIVGITLALIIMDIVFVFSFNTIFNKHQKAITVFLNLKYDNLKSIYNYLKDHDYELSPSIENCIIKMQRNDLEDSNTKQFEFANSNLTFFNNEIRGFLNRNKDLLKVPEIQLALENIKITDSQFRSVVTMYNADCLGYNYWTNFFPTRFIWKLLKFKKKNLIEL